MEVTREEVSRAYINYSNSFHVVITYNTLKIKNILIISIFYKITLLDKVENF
jgi:hypothetical protein